MAEERGSRDQSPGVYDNDDLQAPKKRDAVLNVLEDEDDTPPPLPPRPGARGEPTDTLQSKPTTAISPIDIQTLSFPDGSRGTFSTPGARAASTPVQFTSEIETPGPTTGSVWVGEVDDAMSVMSLAAPTLRPPGDLASLMVGDFNKRSPAWMLLRSQSANVQPFEAQLGVHGELAAFEQEFEDLPDDVDSNLGDEERMAQWKAKLKHYMILSSAGKPIYSRHGDLAVINSFMGVVQTIISFYESSHNPLLGFTAGNTRFVIMTAGPLYLVAISRLGESDSQMRSQLEALYMQILSTLTFPMLTNIFANRPSTDLRKQLQGTEPLLSSLADSFTRGSPSMLLGALECLKLRKAHRHAINNAFLKARTEKLLYGLIVAGGKLVSVIRPRKHSLHPSDLQLIFNMLFESGGVKSGEGENWIPICLPAFNNRGYLYMYVSFLDGSITGTMDSTPNTTNQQPETETSDDIAIILISADKESFFELQTMRGAVVANLLKSGCLSHILASTRAGRPSLSTAIAPNATHLAHFLYKSRPNVQFCLPSFAPHFSSLVARRRLMTLYHELHATAHAKHCHLKVLHCVSEDATSLAWITPSFELYAVAGPNLSRAAMTQGANRVVQWVKREEERLFILGGGVF